MFFDPITAWIVTLMADGMIIAGEKGNSGAATEYQKKMIQQSNRNLNARIRRINEKYGLILAETAFEQIKMEINSTKRSFSFQNGHGQIVIDLDNQDYIIAVLEECAKKNSQYSSDQFQKKAEWYNNAAIEAKRRRKQYAEELAEARIRESKERGNQETAGCILVVIGLIIIVGIAIIMFS